MPTERSVIESFDNDLNQLIDEFKLLNKRANFNEFAKLWKSKRFYLIFHGILHVNQLHEFMDDIFELCIKRLQTEKIYLRKVCLMYVIYACYFKQPDKEVKFNIRIEETHLIMIREFLEECKQKSNFEVIYCWRKLLTDGAVDFVCQTNYYGPWFIKRQNHNRESLETSTVDDEFVEQLRDLNKYQSDYDKLKANVEECEGKEEIKSLDLIENQKSIYTDFVNDFENLKKKFNKS